MYKPGRLSAIGWAPAKVVELHREALKVERVKESN